MNYFKFQPLLKQTLWGGDKIIPFKHLSTVMENVGESWEISGVKDNETIAAGDGRSLNQLVRDMKDRLVGEANYQRFGDEFPLLIKFIDARQDLSIQVHPTDEIAHRQGRERGKTEMWYVMDSAPDAKLYNGLKLQIFKRKDKDGNYRQLHTQEASESINYTVLDDYRTHYQSRINESQLLVECPYFNTAVYDLTEAMTIDYSELDSFVILIGMKGEGTLTIDGETVAFSAGETILVPASAQEVRTEGTIKFLETYVLS